MKKPKLEWHKLTVPQKIQRAREIVAHLTGNANFGTPVPTIAVLVAAINALETAFENASDGGHTLKATMYAKEKILDDLMAQLEAYVASASAGDEQKILSSGLQPKDISSHGKRPVKVVAGKNPGEVFLTADAVPRGSIAYHEFQRCFDPIPSETVRNAANANPWLPIDVISKATLLVENMPASIRLWFRERAIFTKGRKSEWHILGSIVLPPV